MSAAAIFRQFAKRCAEIARRSADPDETKAFSSTVRVLLEVAREDDHMADLLREADSRFASTETANDESQLFFWARA